MKKLMTILMTIVTLMIAALATSCSKEEPTPTFSGDFTNLNIELLESTIDVDSALVIDKITKDGFMWDETMNEYINNSYGLHYSFEFENNNTKTINGGKQEGYTKEQMKEFFKNENNKISNKNLALFKGETFEKWETSYEKICEKNPTNFNNIIKTTENEYYSTHYANNEKAYKLEYQYLTSGPEVKYVLLSVEKSTTKSYIYKEAASQCE